MINRLVMGALFAGVLVCAGSVFAEDEAPPADQTTDEAEATTPEGAARVTDRLAEKFHVDSSVITDLRGQNMGFGEIDHALTLANQLPGGATQENIDQIMDMRHEQNMGWGQIAHELDTTLGSAKRDPIQEPAPPEPPATEPAPGDGTATGSTAEAQSVVRPGATPGSQGKAKGKSWWGGNAPSSAGGMERPGSGGSRGPKSGTHGGGLGHGGGAGSLGGGGVGGGKSSSAPGHNR